MSDTGLTAQDSLNYVAAVLKQHEKSKANAISQEELLGWAFLAIIRNIDVVAWNNLPVGDIGILMQHFMQRAALEHAEKLESAKSDKAKPL